MTLILERVKAGDAHAAEELLPLVYDELRRLAAARMSQEVAGHTLQPTALVHEAWLRLVGNGEARWNSRGHFFGAAAEAMRRILVESARRKQAQRRGGGLRWEILEEHHAVLARPPDELLAVSEALQRLASEDPQAAELVKLRYFVGLALPEVAEVLGLSARTADRIWAYARTWLKVALTMDEGGGPLRGGH